MFVMSKKLLKAEDAFSLIELVMVIMLMGVLILLTPLSRDLLGNSSLKAAVDTIVAELRWMQMEAILKSRDYRMEIYPDGSYIIYYLDPDKVLIKQGNYPGGLTLLVKKSGELVPVADKVILGFNELGHASYARTIAFASEKGETLRIIVSTWMGRIRVERD